MKKWKSAIIKLAILLGALVLLYFVQNLYYLNCDVYYNGELKAIENDIKLMEETQKYTEKYKDMSSTKTKSEPDTKNYNGSMDTMNIDYDNINVIPTPSPTIEPTVNTTPIPVPTPVEAENIDENKVYEAQISEAQSSEYSEPITEGGNQNLLPLGEWTVTFYCSCAECCGQYNGNSTASGVAPIAKHTVAAADLPFGTTIYLEGMGVDGYYVVEDRGVPSGWVDIYVNSHDEIPSWGLGTVNVYQVIE